MVIIGRKIQTLPSRHGLFELRFARGIYVVLRQISLYMVEHWNSLEVIEVVLG
jgi:hypothetical protein